MNTVTQQHPYTRWLVGGAPGSRKSTFFATFPNPGIVFFFDPYGMDAPYVGRGTPTPIAHLTTGVPYRDVMGDDGSLLWRLEYYYDENPRQPVAWERFMARLQTFTFQERAFWNTAVYESMTSMERAAFHFFKYKLNPSAKDGRQWYAGTTEVLSEVLFTTLGTYMDINVGLAAHYGSDYGESAAGMVRMLVGPGKLPPTVAGAYPEYYRAYAQGTQQGVQFLLQTEQAGEWNAFSRVCRAPNPCVPDYGALWSVRSQRLAVVPGAIATASAA